MRKLPKAAARSVTWLCTGLAALGWLVVAPAYTIAGRVAPLPRWQGVVQPAAVFGNDDRIPLPAKYKDLQEKIGLLFNPRSRMVCTAFCVAPDIVATAGHCLFRIAGEQAPR